MATDSKGGLHAVGKGILIMGLMIRILNDNDNNDGYNNDNKIAFWYV